MDYTTILTWVPTEYGDQLFFDFELLSVSLETYNQ